MDTHLGARRVQRYHPMKLPWYSRNNCSNINNNSYSNNINSNKAHNNYNKAHNYYNKSHLSMLNLA